MRFCIALQHLDNNEKIYCPSWNGSVKWHMIKVNGITQIIAESGRDGIDFSVYLYLCLDKEWEIYQEEKLLSWTQVLQGLKDGKKFRRKGWAEDDVFLKNGNRTILIKCNHPERGEFGMSWNPSLEDFEGCDWIEVEIE